MAGLFDFETPEQVRARIGKTGMEQDLALAGLTGTQRANLGGATAGRLFGQALQSAMGYESPEVTRARDIQEAMQESKVDAGDSPSKYYGNLAKSLKERGHIKESFQALQAMQTYAASEAKAARAERELKVKEGELERKKGESISGEAKLKVMQTNAAANTKKAAAAMKAAIARTMGAQAAKNWKSSSVSEQNIKSVVTQLSNDPVFNKLDDDQQGAYAGTVTQAAADLVAVAKKNGKSLTFTQAQSMVKSVADKHVAPGMLYGATFDKEGFTKEFLGQIQ
jgi:hypothetical protein